MGIWKLEISEEEKYEFGSDSEPNWYLLAENKISDILSECRHRIKNDSLNHKWCNKYGEQNEPYDIIIENNGIRSTLDVKARCLKGISLEMALNTWTLDIDESQIERQIENHYYICFLWKKNIDMLHIVGWIERREVIKLFENNEIIKRKKKIITLINNESYYEPIYKIPLKKLKDMKTLFLKLGIDADFAKYDDTEGQKSLDFF